MKYWHEDGLRTCCWNTDHNTRQIFSLVTFLFLISKLMQAETRECLLVNGEGRDTNGIGL